MSKHDVVIHGGIVVTCEGAERLDIAVDDGRISALAPEIDEDATERIPAHGLHVFPGVVDAHVHFNEPGREHWEGIATGSEALAAGGGTCFCDMPLNSAPPTIDAAAIEAKAAAARRRSLVDFGLWGGLVPGNLGRLDEMAERGAVGFKAFMCSSGIDDFPAADDLTLLEGMRIAARLGRVVAVHAENGAITGALFRKAVAEGRSSARDYLRSRPVVSELEAIQRAILFAGETGCALHIAHVSTGRAVAMVAEAKVRGVDVTCETCPHYLVFTEEDLERLGAVLKCAPPLRSPADREALWNEVAAGRVDFIASDHSPSPPETKAGTSFFQAWGGISGCQSTLAAMLTAGCAAGRLSPAQVAFLVSEGPARRLGLFPRKGTIAVGADADLALVDLGASEELSPADLRYRHRQSPYAGMRFACRIVRTLVRGITVVRDGRAVSPPVGRMVSPGTALPPRRGRAA